MATKLILRLKTTSSYNLLRHNWFIVAFFLLLNALSVQNMIFILFFVGFGFLVWKKSIIVFSMCVLCCVMFLTVFFLHSLIVYENRLDETRITGRVIQVTPKKYYKEAKVRSEGQTILIRYNGSKTLQSGQQIMAHGIMMKPEKARIPGAFDYAEHLLRKNIHWIFKTDDIEIIGEEFHVSQIGERISSHFDRYSPESSKYLKAFILGETADINEQDRLDITKLGIGHLFAVSGLHVHTLVFCFRFAMKRVGIKETFSEPIVVVILGLYMIASRMLVSVIRAALMEMFAIADQKLKLGLDGLDRFSLIFIAFLICFPNVLYQVSFVLSFSVT